MPRFSRKSKSKLESCHKDLQRLFEEVVKHFYCTVIDVHIGKERQNNAYDEGKSKLRFPNGKHNQSPSIAVDIIPYPVDWSDRDRHHLFAGFVLGMATQMDLEVRWGGDWDRDTKTKDNKFDDLVHFELAD